MIRVESAMIIPHPRSASGIIALLKTTKKLMLLDLSDFIFQERLKTILLPRILEHGQSNF